MPPRPIVRKSFGPKDGAAGKGKGAAAPRVGASKGPANQILKNRTKIDTPTCDIIPDFGLQHSVSSTYKPGVYGQIEELPPLAQVSEDKFNDMMRQKLDQCRVICNYVDPMTDLKPKALKQTYLQEILDHISQPRFYKLLEPDTFVHLFKMIKANIIRAMPPIPPLARVPVIGEDIIDTIYECAWPHLEIVYQIFQRFLESSLLDPSQFLQFIDDHFIAHFLMLFGSSDSRERDALKMVLHRLYLKFVQQRPLIRKAIQHIFFTYIYETKYFCGITELLEIMVSIINGYAVPLKQEHKDFLIKILLPLHTSHFLHLIQMNLLYCVMQYIQKDASLIPIVIKELLKLWPVSNSLKELYFITDLGKIIELISEDQFEELMVELFHKIGECITSNNFQVSEAGMLLWKNDRFLQMTQNHAKELFPIICPYLYKTGTNHWNTAIKNLAVSVIRICMETAIDVFEAFSKSMKGLEQQEIQKTMSEKETWKMVFGNAVQRDNQIKLDTTLPNLERVYAK